ncbi:hypothetical protein B9Z19DRAFT_55688 [Tuber borchii]|uniref:Uncharacterized protein n=1 Tax=Tuber borchii TaxID=42251 RepID=A0A2T6ZT17_TUBBO|nr:hypothetical protein B9Z19DRAFT_55688 [Tuber borchii]
MQNLVDSLHFLSSFDDLKIISNPTIIKLSPADPTSELETLQQMLQFLSGAIAMSKIHSPFRICLSFLYMTCLVRFLRVLALYATVERIGNVRALHYSNRVRTIPLWLAYTAFDFVTVLITFVCAIIYVAATNDIWFHAGYLFLGILGYWLEFVLLTYNVSLMAGSQLSAFGIVTSTVVKL